ncbi:hypothetical protein HU200_026922 [Digitaria exilis]|uniref:Core Histone H2A/H2B/H3 domain-containing protein n=1 Tax=Digitaria exilis TaxID=1010633 RepID=A0A835EX02_9POAL|nr:hypothetical protein HU200_026922 [Digitaria exilis]
MARTKHPAVRTTGRAPKKQLQFDGSPSQRAAQAGSFPSPPAPTQCPSGRGCGIVGADAGASGRKQKKRRWRPGTVALREIRKLQKSIKLAIPFAPFVRLVREISTDYSTEVTRWTPEALLAIQEVNAEACLVFHFSRKLCYTLPDYMKCTFHLLNVYGVQ